MATIWYKDPSDFRAADVFRPEKYRKIFDMHANTCDLDAIWRAFNVVDGNEIPVRLRVRSMSVGDVVEINGIFHVCDNAGWTQIRHVDDPPP